MVLINITNTVLNRFTPNFRKGIKLFVHFTTLIYTQLVEGKLRCYDVVGVSHAANDLISFGFLMEWD